MKYIEKQAPPTAWLEAVGKLSEAEKKDWGNLTIEAREALQAALLAEQGHLCCYCGQRISIERGLVLEHLKPRADHEERIFDYDNLLASCQGSILEQTHSIQQGEELSRILEAYTISLEDLIELNPGLNPYALQRGQKVVVGRGSPQQLHCDASKGRQEIPIDPSMQECEHHFLYDELTGKVNPQPEDQRASQTIEILGLNVGQLVRSRRAQIIKYWNALAVEELNQNQIRQLIKGYYTPDDQDRLTPYCQVLVRLLTRELAFRRKLKNG